MVGPHPLAKETSLGAASSVGRHPLAGETSLGAASSEASGAGPAPDAFASREVSLARRKGPTRAQGVFPGQHHLLPRNSVGIGKESIPALFINPNWCAKLKRLSRQGTCGFFFDAVFLEASFILRPPAVGRSKSTLLC
jgi:hypothetical protein